MTVVEQIIEYCKKEKNRDLNSRREVYYNIIRFCEEQAKEMEKEQIKDSYCDGRLSIINKQIISAEKYYNETFKSE